MANLAIQAKVLSLKTPPKWAYPLLQTSKKPFHRLTRQSTHLRLPLSNEMVCSIYSRPWVQEGERGIQTIFQALKV